MATRHSDPPTSREPGADQSEPWSLTPTELPKRRHEKISETVAREIVSDLISRRVRPGTMLPSELALARQYGVGRSSLREALRILEVPGIVQMRHGAHGGPMFNGAHAEDLASMLSLFLAISGVTIGDLIEARRSIEPMAARLAAANRNEGALREIAAHARWLESLAENGEASDGQPPRPSSDDEYAQTTLDFHQLICASSGNSLLDLLCQAVISLLDRSLTEVRFDRHFDDATRREVDAVHRRMADAILRGDGVEAERLTASHLERYEQRVKRETPWVWSRPVSWF